MFSWYAENAVAIVVNLAFLKYVCTWPEKPISRSKWLLFLFEFRRGGMPPRFYFLGRFRDTPPPNSTEHHTSRPPPPTLKAIVESNGHFIHPSGGSDFTAHYSTKPAQGASVDVVRVLRDTAKSCANKLSQDPRRRTELQRTLRRLKGYETQLKRLEEPVHPNHLVVYI